MFKLLKQYKKTILLSIYFAVSWIPLGVFYFLFALNTLSHILLILLFINIIIVIYKDYLVRMGFLFFYLSTFVLYGSWFNISQAVFPSYRLDTLEAMNYSIRYFYIIIHIIWILTFALWEYKTAKNTNTK